MVPGTALANTSNYSGNASNMTSTGETQTITIHIILYSFYS